MERLLDIFLGIVMLAGTISMLLFLRFSYVLITAKPSKPEKEIASETGTTKT